MRSASPVWSASMADASPTGEAAPSIEWQPAQGPEGRAEFSRDFSHTAPIHGLWDKPEPQWSLADADDALVQTRSGSHTVETPPSRVPGQEKAFRPGDESPAPVRGELMLSPPRSDWDATLLCGCFRKWAIQTDESRRMQLEFSHAVAQFEEEAERWREYVLTRAFRLWRLSIRMQIAAAYAAETVYRYCWHRWTLLVRITLAELHREDVLLCSCLTAFRQVCVAIAHDRRYQARATLMRLSLAAAHGQQKQLACAYSRQHGLDDRWRRWIDFAREASRKRQASTLAAAQAIRWRHRHMPGWLDRWVSYASEKTASRIRRTTAGTHCRRSTLKFCTRTWYRYLQIRKHKLRRVAQVLIVLSSRILGTAMSRWKMTAELARKLKHAVMRLSHRVVLTSWDAWIQRIREWKQMELITALAANHSWVTGARWAFCVWCDNATRYRLVNHKVKLAVARLLNLTLGSAFGTWADTAKEVIDQRNKLERIIALIMNRALHSAFRGWEASTVEKRLDREKMLRVVKMFQNVRLGAAFQGWFARTQSSITNREKLLWVIKLLQGSHVVSAFNAWRNRTEFKVESRKKVARAVRLMLNSVLHSAFAGWHDKSSAKMAHKAKLRKAIVVMGNVALSSAWGGWCKYVEVRTSNRSKVNGVIGRMHNSLIGKAFESWARYTDAVFEAREQLHNAVLRCDKCVCVARVVAGWHRATRRLARRRLKREHERAKYVVYHKVLTHVHDAVKQRAFNTWVFVLAEIMHNRDKLERFLSMFFNRFLRSAFNGWKASTLEKSLNREKMMRVVKMFQSQTLASAFNSWFDTIQTMLDMKKVMIAVLAALSNRKMKSALQAWSHCTIERIEQREIMFKAARLIANYRTAAAFNGWCARCTEKAEQRDKAGWAVRHILHRSLVCAFNSWTLNARQMVESKHIMMAVIRTFSRKGLAAALSRWVEFSLERAGMRALFKRFQNRALTASFHSWQELAIDRATKKEQLHRALEILGGSRRGSAFSGWLATVQERIENRIKLQAVHTRMRSLAVAGAFTTWASYATEKTTIQNKLSAVLVRISKLALAGSFNAWCNTAQRSLQVNGFIFDLTTKWRTGQLRQVFESWFVWAARRTELAAVENAIALAREQKAKAGLMRSWSLLFVACCTYRLFMARLAIHTWAKHATSAKHARILSRAMAKFCMRTVSLCFEGWKDANGTSVRHQKVVQKVLSKINNRALSASFNAWAERAVEQAAFGKWASLKAESFARRLLGDMMYSAFRTWREWNLRRERTRLIGTRIEELRARTVKRQRMLTWRQRYVQSSTITRIRRQGVQVVWGHWTQLVQREIYRREQIKAAAQRWRTCTTAGRFRHWQSSIVEARRIRAAAQKLQTRQWWCRWRCHSTQSVLGRLNGAVKRILLHRIGMALGKWREFCSMRAQQRATVAAAVKRMQQRELVAVFNRWDSATRKQAGDNRAVATAVRRLRARIASSAFVAWASLSACSASKKHILASAVNRLRLRSVRMAFMRWWVEAEHSVTLRGLLRVWVGRRVAAMLSHYISVWRDTVLVNGHRRWAADTIAVATCARLAARAWSAWVLIHKCDMVQQTANARGARIVLHQWFSATQRCAEHRWRLQVVRERRAARILGLLLAAWRYHAIYSCRSREVVAASRLRRHRAQAAYCLTVWRHFVAYTMELRRALWLWLGRRVAVMLTASFRRWLEFCTRQATTELTWIRAVDFASVRINAALDQCFFVLRRHALEKAERRQLRDMAADCCTRRQLKACFESWRGHLAELALADRQSSLAFGAFDSSLGGYLDAASLATTSPMSTMQEMVAIAPPATSIGQATELQQSPWRSESLVQLGRELEALASSFQMIGRPVMAPAATQ